MQVPSGGSYLNWSIGHTGCCSGGFKVYSGECGIADHLMFGEVGGEVLRENSEVRRDLRG